jgi:GTP diphosphokinase / guanosine-3',5'-bis(diphosphate) 3'-diphosphatase
MANEWVAVLRAADAAARWHVHQRRKGAAKEPYINHLLEVATLVAEATEGTDPNLVVAALLHDAIEDCDVPIKIIADTFGTDVADLVKEVTDDKTIPKEEQKKRQVESADRKSDRAKTLKLADKTSNIRALISSPAVDWSVRRKIDYIEWGRQVVEGLRGVNPYLEDEFDNAAWAAEQALMPKVGIRNTAKTMAQQSDFWTLFEPPPETWGLRGDPFLWRDMQRLLARSPLPDTTDLLASAIEVTFKKLTRAQLLNEESIAEGNSSVFVERYARGGMSSGQISMEFWRCSAIPLLCGRYKSIRRSTQHRSQ